MTPLPLPQSTHIININISLLISSRACFGCTNNGSFCFLVEKSIWVFEEIEKGIQLLVILIDVGFISLNYLP